MWAIALGGLSAVSLPMGSVLGIVFKPKPYVTGFLAAFGAGALLAALAIELVAPTAAALTGSGRGHGEGTPLHQFYALIIGSIIGGSLFVILDQLVNSHGGFLRKSASTITYFTTGRKQSAAKILQDLSGVALLRNIPLDQGDDGDRMFFIRQGIVELSEHGNVFRKLGGSDVVGEIALLTGAARTATAQAAGHVEALVLLKVDFDRLRRESKELDENIRRLAIDRMEDLRSIQESDARVATAWADQAVEAIRLDHRIPTPDDMRKARQEHSGAPLAIWLGILLDGIPESIVLGTVFMTLVAAKTAAGTTFSFTDVIPYTLIAGLFLSNFPEALSSSVGMKTQGWKSTRIVMMWMSLFAATALGAGAGYLLGDILNPTTVVLIEGMAAGAMLTMIASAMIPEAVYQGGANLVGISTLGGFLSAIAFKIFE
jgi:zinc transporter ZupT